MAVVTLFMSDRDTSRTFTSKKEADAYDRMLELAEAITQFAESNIEGLSEEQAESIGLLFARNKDQLAAAIKGKTDALDEANTESAETEETESNNAAQETSFGQETTLSAVNS